MCSPGSIGSPCQPVGRNEANEVGTLECIHVGKKEGGSGRDYFCTFELYGVDLVGCILRRVVCVIRIMGEHDGRHVEIDKHHVI